MKALQQFPKMYLKFLVLCLVHAVSSRSHQVVKLNLTPSFKGPVMTNTIQPREEMKDAYKLTPNVVCCCKSSDRFKDDPSSLKVIQSDSEIIDCNKFDSSSMFRCYCQIYPESKYINLNNKQKEDNRGCTSSNAYIYLAAAVIILLTMLLIGNIILLWKKTGFRMFKYTTVFRFRNQNRKPIAKTFDENSNAELTIDSNDSVYNERYEIPIVRQKYDNLLNKRTSSHIYHSLDNVHMVTQDVDKMFVKKNLLNRGPQPLPHQNVQTVSNLMSLIAHSNPHRNSLVVTPQHPRSLDNRENFTSQLNKILNKRKPNGLDCSLIPPPQRMPPPPPRKPTVPGHTANPNIYEEPECDWMYEEYRNDSIYQLQ